MRRPAVRARRVSHVRCPLIRLGVLARRIGGFLLSYREAGGQDVALGGGPAAIRQFLSAGLIDEMHLAIAPVLLGECERIFGHLQAGQRLLVLRADLRGRHRSRPHHPDGGEVDAP